MAAAIHVMRVSTQCMLSRVRVVSGLLWLSVMIVVLLSVMLLIMLLLCV